VTNPTIEDARSPFPGTGGESAAILRAIDWSAHPFGDPPGWPEPLKAAIRITLSSRFPMMVHWGPDLTTFYNDAYAPSLGGKHPGNLGRPAREWWDEMWDQLTPIFDPVLAGETIYVENACYTPDRDGAPKEAWFTHCHSPLWDQNGKVAGIFLVVTETTRQVLAERGRQIDEVRNRQIVDSASDFAIIATDLDGQVTRWNAGAERVLGWSEEEMCGNTVERIFTPEDRTVDRGETEMRGARETGRANDERWHLKKTGERFWAQGEMTPLKTEAGDFVGYVKVLRDRTIERLREQRLSLLAQASGGLLSSTDPDAVIDSIFKAGAEALGVDQSYSYVLAEDCQRLRLTHAIGMSDEALQMVPLDKPLCDIVAQSREPLILNDLQANRDERYVLGRAAGITAYAGFPILGRDRLYGVISFASLRQPAFDEEALTFFATLARFLSIGRERLDRESTLSDMAMGLEARVEERTRELMTSEEALRQSQKMDAVGQLTGGVAHDFNNLLTVIRGSVDLLRRDNLTPERRARYIDAIGDTADRAARLTSQLLAFARRQALKPEVLDVEDRISRIVEMLDTVTGSHVHVAVRTSSRQCIVRADASQFETALVNMAVNARDAMNASGTLTISIDGGKTMPPIRGHGGGPGPFVTVQLSDTGVGISNDDLTHIFEPFFTTKEIGKGTGLGLSQVFGFAKQSGGDVDVSSTPGEGTAFTLYLPQAEEGVSIDTVNDSDQDAAEGAGLCVLVVEDNVDVGRFSTQALEDFGYRTVWVTSAEEALERLSVDGNGFDAVFSDVVMPGMGGIELAKRLAVTLPTMPVVLATGYSHVLAQEVGHGFPLLQKPYSAESLSKILRRTIK
jgi:PAS domain S-box-containing protein